MTSQRLRDLGRERGRVKFEVFGGEQIRNFNLVAMTGQIVGVTDSPTLLA